VPQPTMLLGAVSLGQALSSHWDRSDMNGLECLVSIPIVAVVPFTVIICAVRRAASDQSG
jgi:uncharacterized membrane protein YjjP (DUF1212 family)